jgi:hypothetical protein
MGRLGDRGFTRLASIAADLAVIAGSLLAMVAGGFLAQSSTTLGVIGLFAAAILLDFGVIGDQTLGRRAINLLEVSAIGRRNGLFVGIFFLGGAVGSAVAGPAASLAGWSGVCLAGAGFGAAALVVSLVFTRTPATAGARSQGEAPGALPMVTTETRTLAS